jgi:hypothetical protein
MIIGLSGYARSGKDEAAKVLVEKHGFTRVAFADKLREVLYALNPVVVANIKYHGPVPVDEYTGPVYMRLQEIIDVYGWEHYKSSPFSQDVRYLLQRLGTEAGRQTLWDSIWVDAAFAGVDSDKIVVTDVRFPNEAQAIWDRGGYNVRVERYGVGPAVGADGTVHPSETSLDDWYFDYHLFNHDGLEEYHAAVDELVGVLNENRT